VRGQRAIGVAPQRIHLPKPVLCGHIALRDEQIVLGGRVNVGHAMRVALHGYRSRKPGHVQFSIQRRQCRLRHPAEPHHDCAGAHKQEGH
jgi:hypothetical protein